MQGKQANFLFLFVIDFLNLLPIHIIGHAVHLVRPDFLFFLHFLFHFLCRFFLLPAECHGGQFDQAVHGLVDLLNGLIEQAEGTESFDLVIPIRLQGENDAAVEGPATAIKDARGRIVAYGHILHIAPGNHEDQVTPQEVQFLGNRIERRGETHHLHAPGLDPGGNLVAQGRPVFAFALLHGPNTVEIDHQEGWNDLIVRFFRAFCLFFLHLFFLFSPAVLLFRIPQPDMIDGVAVAHGSRQVAGLLEQIEQLFFLVVNQAIRRNDIQEEFAHLLLAIVIQTVN